MKPFRRHRLLVSLVTAVACGCGSAPAPGASASAPGFRIVDLMPRYWAFREATATATPAERVRRFRTDVIGAEPAFFEQVIGPPDDARLERYLETMTRYDPVMRRIGPELVAAVPASWSRLRSLFSDLVPGVRIFVTPSLFNSNGQVRYLDDTLVVMLGPDVQAYVEVVIDSGRRTPPGLGLEHELGHYHHWRVNPEIARAARTFFKPGDHSALYYNLWSEGVATWIARRLNPDLPLAQVLGPGLDPVRDRGLVPALAREFLGKLDSRDGNDVRDLFYLAPDRRRDIPARSAYYLGYLVVDRLAAGRSPDQLVRLGGPELRAAIAEELLRLGALPSGPPA